MEGGEGCVKVYYQDDLVTIYHGDCREWMPEADVVITDPPYVLTAHGGGIGRQRQYLASIADRLDKGFDLEMLDGWPRWMVFCSKEQLLPLLSRAAASGRWMLLTWNKPDPAPLVNANYLPDTEYVVHHFQTAADLAGGYAQRSRFIQHPAGGSQFGHPTEKPIGVMRRLVAVGSHAGEVVLDPFAGTGTTLRAAKDLGRRAIGIEWNEQWCEAAARRCSQEVLGLTA